MTSLLHATAAACRRFCCALLRSASAATATATAHTRLATVLTISLFKCLARTVISHLVLQWQLRVLRPCWSHPRQHLPRKLGRAHAHGDGSAARCGRSGGKVAATGGAAREWATDFLLWDRLAVGRSGFFRSAKSSLFKHEEYLPKLCNSVGTIQWKQQRSAHLPSLEPYYVAAMTRTVAAVWQL